jgi:hypothetical protein
MQKKSPRFLLQKRMSSETLATGECQAFKEDAERQTSGGHHFVLDAYMYTAISKRTQIFSSMLNLTITTLTITKTTKLVSYFKIGLSLHIEIL